jgi:hypothetical protein
MAMADDEFVIACGCVSWCRCEYRCRELTRSEGEDVAEKRINRLERYLMDIYLRATDDCRCVISLTCGRTPREDSSTTCYLRFDIIAL